MRRVVPEESVVVAAGEYSDTIRLHFVDKAVLLVDPAGHAPGKVSLEPFGFADALERVALNLADESDDPQGHRPVVLDPER
jgi:hypothetical protein